MFVTPPRDEGDGITVPADCTTNIAGPVIDTLFTGTNLFSTLWVAGQDNVTNKGEAVGVGLLATGFWLSSAIYGYYNTSRCAALKSGDEPGPYRRPVRIRRTVLSGPPRPPQPPAGEDNDADGPAPPAPPANAAPAAPQQRDDDDPTDRQYPGPRTAAPEPSGPL